MKYCSNCGSSTYIGIPEGDNFARHICGHCDTIHYSNPKIVAGCIAQYEGKILLCKRAIEPRYGYWTIPAGFMENHESVDIAAQRETWEEAEAQVDNIALYGLYSLPTISQVYIIYQGTVKNGAFGVGSESLDTRLYALDDIPWDDLAFDVVKIALKRYVTDFAAGTFPSHIETLIR